MKISMIVILLSVSQRKLIMLSDRLAHFLCSRTTYVVEKKVTGQRSHPRNNFVTCMPSNSQLNFWWLLEKVELLDQCRHIIINLTAVVDEQHT